MRTSSVIAASLIAITAAPAFAVPLGVQSIEARGLTKAATNLVQGFRNVIIGFSEAEGAAFLTKVAAGEADKIKPGQMVAALRAVGRKSATLEQQAAKELAKAAALRRFAEKAETAGDVALLKTLAVDKDSQALEVLAASASPKAVKATLRRLGSKPVTNMALNTAVRLASKNPENAAALEALKISALSSLKESIANTEEIRLLKALGRNGDKDVKAAFASLPKEAQKAMGVTAIAKRPIGAGKIVAIGGDAALVAGGGTIAVGTGVLYKLANQHVDASSVQSIPATVPGGAIDEATQRKILAALAQDPSQYDAAMKEIRATIGITPAEVTLFESMNPKSTPESAATASKVSIKRSLTDLD